MAIKPKSQKAWNRACRLNAIIKQYIKGHPIPFDLLHTQSQYIVDTEVGRLLRHHPLPPSIEEEDLKQEASIILLRCLDLYDPTKQVPFIAYLRKALHRSLATYLATQSNVSKPHNRTEPIPEEVPYQDLVDNSPSIHPNLTVQPNYLHINLALEKLPAIQRELLTLRTIYHHPPSYIATLKNLPQPYVVRQIDIAKHHLAKLLGYHYTPVPRGIPRKKHKGVCQ